MNTVKLNSALRVDMQTYTRAFAQTRAHVQIHIQIHIHKVTANSSDIPQPNKQEPNALSLALPSNSLSIFVFKYRAKSQNRLFVLAILDLLLLRDHRFKDMLKSAGSVLNYITHNLTEANNNVIICSVT